MSVKPMGRVPVQQDMQTAETMSDPIHVNARTVGLFYFLSC